MDQLQNIADDSSLGLTFRVAFALQGTLIIFFVVSPAMGFLLAQGIKNRVNLVLSWCVGMLVVLVAGFGMNLLLRRGIPESSLSDVGVALLSGAASVALGILLARYLVWWMADPGKPTWVIEHDKMDPDEMMPFEKRRRHEMERRKRNQ